MKIYIAGAHSRGTTVGYYMQYLHPNLTIEAYLYNNDEENPIDINGIPVIRIDDNIHLDVELPVYIGTRGVNQPGIIDTLRKCGMKNIIPVDVKLDLRIRNEFLRKYYTSMGRDYIKINDLSLPEGQKFRLKNKYCVYVVNSVYDSVLKTSYFLEDYEKRIQVGTELTDKRLQCDFYDNMGNNISDKNNQFCELTGMYWLWKNSSDDVVGMVHYRRHFILPDKWKEIMEAYDIDVILPLPLYVMPSIEENYKGRHIARNWDLMMEYLRENLVEDYEKAKVFFCDTALYSPCNMFIMKKNILDDFCSWMFPILFYVANNGGMFEDTYQNRYPGFLAERLLTYFFEKNRDKYKVAYSDKNFIH